MAAFHGAVSMGADAIEFDVHVTADGKPVVLHDYELARTTSGVGLVHERDLDYVRTLSAGRWFDGRYATESVPLLDEVLALQGVDFELEVKGLPTAQLVSEIIDVVQRFGVADRVQLTGHHHLALTAIHRQVPRVRLGLFPPAYQDWMTDHLYQQIVQQTALLGGFDVVHLRLPLLERVDVPGLQAAGLLVHAGDVNSAAELTAASELGVDHLTTNDPRGARRLLLDLARG